MAAIAAGLSLMVAGGSAGAATSAQASGVPQLTIAMNGSSINVGGALQSGAGDVGSTTTNESQAKPTLLRLNPGGTADQVFAFLNSPAASDPNSVNRFGSIAFSAQVDKGTSHVLTILQPGNYLALDTSGDNPAKFPHTSFTVLQTSQPATLPAPRATIK